MHKRPRILIGSAVIATISAFVIYRTTSASEGENAAIVASGTVEATQAQLGFQLSGRLERITPHEGDQITQGDTIAWLERDELTAQRAIAAAQVASAEALLLELTRGSRQEEISRARASLAVATEKRDAAKRDVERLAPLADQSLISRQAFDHQRTEMSVADGEVAQAKEELQLLVIGPRFERIAAQRAALAQARATVDKIDAMLAQTDLIAPFAGTITVRHREPGETMTPGLPVVTVRNLEDRWIRLYVPGDEVGRLSLGQSASITADAYENRHYTGTVSYIASVAEFTPRNVQTTKDRVKLVYEVRVRIKGDTAVDLKPGLPADVRFRTPLTTSHTH